MSRRPELEEWPTWRMEYGRCGICGKVYVDRYDHLVGVHLWAPMGFLKTMRSVSPELFEAPK